MKYSLIKSVLSEPWFIEPAAAAIHAQLFRGLMMGLVMESEADSNFSYYIDGSSFGVIPYGKKVNVVRLNGLMLRYDAPCSFGTRTIAARLLEAEGDRLVVGHVILIDSGGGAANSVPDLSDAIRDCEKPVVAFVDGTMASAAMYAGSYCDHIVAHRPEDRIGCIGTVIEINGYPAKADLADGSVNVRIYADASGEKNAEYEEALKGNFTPIRENILNPLNEKFVAAIMENRPCSKPCHLRGRTFFAKDVVGTLVDEIGGFDTAVSKVIELSNLNNKTVKMEGLEHLQSVASCRDLEMTDDVCSLNMGQLADIDARIKAGDENTGAQEKLSDAQATIAALEKSSAEKDVQIADGKKRIDELEAMLAAGLNPLAATANHNGGHADGAPKEMSPDEAADYCRKVLNGEI